MAKRVTAADVARSLGVSRATVGFVLNDTPGQTISEPTRRRVLAEAARLGYRPHSAARTLASGRSHIVLVLLPDWPVEHSMRAHLDEASLVLDRAGYSMVTTTPHPGGQAVPLWQSLAPEVVLALTELRDDEYEAVRASGAATLVPGRDATGLEQELAFTEGPRVQVEHLLDTGRRRIAYAGSADPRLAGLDAQRRVELLGRPLPALRPRELARRLALLPQSPVAPEGMTVGDLAERGRQPHRPWYRPWSPEDAAIATEAITSTGVADLASRPLDELSGGQRQRAWIAMTLAQQPDVLLLDEPTTHLDLAHAVDILDLVVRLRSQGITVVTVLHDLSLAARYSDTVVVLQDGRVRAQGPPADVLDAGLLREVFGLDARVYPDPVDGRPTVVPVGHA